MPCGGLLAAALALWLAGLPGCGGPPAARGQEALASVAAELVAALGLPPGSLAWAGLRTDQGESTPATAALDEQVASALIRRGVALVPADGLGGAAWTGSDVLPQALWQDAPAPQVLAGRLEMAGPWAYVRLFLVRAGTGQLLGQATARLAARHLAGELEAAAAGGAAGVEIEVHLLGLRQEGGIPHGIEIGPQSSLLAGDQLQVRFRVARDCQVWILLFQSSGARQDLFAAAPVYSGRWQYAPGPEEDAWLTLDQAGAVYTLYVVAARKLNPDLEQLWSRVDDLVHLGQVDRYAGLEQVDRALADLAVLRPASAPAAQVWRGAAEVPRGKSEEFMLDEGLTVKSQAEVLSAPTGVIRAVSFEVR